MGKRWFALIVGFIAIDCSFDDCNATFGISKCIIEAEAKQRHCFACFIKGFTYLFCTFYVFYIYVTRKNLDIFLMKICTLMKGLMKQGFFLRKERVGRVTGICRVCRVDWETCLTTR